LVGGFFLGSQKVSFGIKYRAVFHSEGIPFVLSITLINLLPKSHNYDSKASYHYGHIPGRMSVFFGLNADESKRKRQVFAHTDEITTVEQDRKIWIDALYKIARPLIHNLAENTLHKNIPVGTKRKYDGVYSNLFRNCWMHIVGC
jgi:hypothetical protein